MEALHAVVAAHAFELEDVKPAELLTLVWSREATVKAVSRIYNLHTYDVYIYTYIYIYIHIYIYIYIAFELEDVKPAELLTLVWSREATVKAVRYIYTMQIHLYNYIYIYTAIHIYMSIYTDT